MRMGRAAIFVSLALSIGVAPLAAHAQQPAGPPPQIQTAQTFLMTWGGEKWDEMKAVTADTVTVKVGPGVYTLAPATHKSDVQLTLPFRGLSTVRNEGKVVAISVSELSLKAEGGTEKHGKARLAAVLDEAARAALARAMAERVIGAAHMRPVVVVSSAPDVVAWASGHQLAVIDDPDGGVDRRKVPFLELHVDRGADDLNDFAELLTGFASCHLVSSPFGCAVTGFRGNPATS